MAGRADRRALRQHARRVHRHGSLLRLADQRPAHRVALRRHRPTLARVPRPLRRPAGAVARHAAGDRPGARDGDLGDRRDHDARRPLRRARPSTRRWPRSRPTNRSRCCSRRAPVVPCRWRRCRRGAEAFTAWPVPGRRGDGVVPRRRTARSARPSPARRRIDVVRRRSRATCPRPTSTRPTGGNIWSVDAEFAWVAEPPGTAATLRVGAVRRRHDRDGLGLGRPVDLQPMHRTPTSR